MFNREEENSLSNEPLLLKLFDDFNELYIFIKKSPLSFFWKILGNCFIAFN